MKDILLGVNIDHIATLRNARGTSYPDPVHAADIAERAGADGITVHLREDRRHIKDRDVEILARTINTRLNLEMAVTDEMLEAVDVQRNIAEAGILIGYYDADELADARKGWKPKPIFAAFNPVWAKAQRKLKGES